MQSLLSDSFGRSQKPNPKRQQNSEEQQEQQEQQEESKREEQEQNQSEGQIVPQRKQSSISEELQPMKDAFESDESYLIVTEQVKDQKGIADISKDIENSPRILKGNSLSIVQQNGQVNGTSLKSKRISKRKKQFSWRYMWTRQQNAVKGSKPLWVRRWVRVKVTNPEVQQTKQQMKEQ